MMPSFEPILSSFGLVFMGEMGDKTQLLAFSLAARFKKPGWVMLGILIATLANHFLATYFGAYLSQQISPRAMAFVLAILFLGFGVWVLKPDAPCEVKECSNASALWTTGALFFCAEFGDKTQLATIALAAKFQSIYLVLIGTTLGMLGADGLAVYLGERFSERIPMVWVRRFAASFYFIFAILSAVQGFRQLT